MCHFIETFALCSKQLDVWSKYNINYGNNMVFTSKHNMEMTKSEKLLKKKREKKILEFFPIWRHLRKGVVQGFPNTHFQQFF